MRRTSPSWGCGSVEAPGLGFKVAAVPFHAWTPDVYQGAPTPVVAYMASAVKAAGFAAIVRVFIVTFGSFEAEWQPAVYALAVATLLVGAFLAVVQRDAKRMLAYSSISHAGFILVGVQAASDRGIAYLGRLDGGLDRYTSLQSRTGRRRGQCSYSA